MSKKLSIVIVNLNTRDLTIGCLRSIEKEAGSLSFEVLLTDNGSSDGSVEALKSLAKEPYWKSKITLIFNDSNTGYAKANNQGIRKAKGKYILLLNNDTIVHQNALQRLVSFADKNADAGVVGSRLLNIDGTLQMSCFHFPTITNAIKEKTISGICPIKKLFTMKYKSTMNAIIINCHCNLKEFLIMKCFTIKLLNCNLS